MDYDSLVAVIKHGIETAELWVAQGFWNTNVLLEEDTKPFGADRESLKETLGRKPTPYENSVWESIWRSTMQSQQPIATDCKVYGKASI
jgi:hypothetical protein